MAPGGTREAGGPGPAESRSVTSRARVRHRAPSFQPDAGFLIISQIIFRESLSQVGLTTAAIRSDCALAPEDPRGTGFHH